MSLLRLAPKEVENARRLGNLATDKKDTGRNIFAGMAQAKAEEKPEVSVNPANDTTSSRVNVNTSVPPWIDKLRNKNKK